MAILYAGNKFHQLVTGTLIDWGSQLLVEIVIIAVLTADIPRRERIEFLQQEIDRIDAQLNSLKNNEDSLETFARQRFLFAEPGDDVYIDD